MIYKKLQKIYINNNYVKKLKTSMFSNYYVQMIKYLLHIGK